MTARQYAADIAKSLKHHATWLPGLPISVGAIGKFDDGVFVPIGHLTNSLGVPIPMGPDDKGKDDISHVSSDGTSVHVKVSGKASSAAPSVPSAHAGIGIDFSNTGSTVFIASGLVSHRADLIRLRPAIAALMLDGRWDRDWAFVSLVVQAEKSTILVAKGRDGKIEFDLGADVEATGIELLNADIEIGVSYQKQMSTMLRSAGGLTPLFRAHRAKRGWWSGRTKLQPTFAKRAREVSGAGGEDLSVDADPFEELDVLEVLDE